MHTREQYYSCVSGPNLTYRDTRTGETRQTGVYNNNVNWTDRATYRGSCIHCTWLLATTVITAFLALLLLRVQFVHPSSSKVHVGAIRRSPNATSVSYTWTRCTGLIGQPVAFVNISRGSKSLTFRSLICIFEAHAVFANFVLFFQQKMDKFGLKTEPRIFV